MASEPKTIPELKAACLALGTKPPSSLKKPQLLEFYHTLKSQTSAPITEPSQLTTAQLTDQMVPKYCPEDWKTHLRTYGWATVPIPDFNPEPYVDHFYTWMEQLNAGFIRSDRKTWRTNTLHPMLHGIDKHFTGHLPWVWDLREKCIPIFQEIWNTPDLLTSFDGTCFLYKPTRTVQTKSWIHVDQYRDDRDLITIQGAVNLIESGPDDGGLVVLEGSHASFGAYMDRNPLLGYHWGPSNMADPDLSDRTIVKVCAPAGHLLLWDSRTHHANTSPKSDRARMVSYVCMVPRAGCPEDVLQKRIKAFEGQRMTSHSPYGRWFSVNPAEPRTYGNEVNRPRDQTVPILNEVQKKLVGYL